ncbi:reverse transcriptase domain-containing protein [Tanacetum coccineum]
MRRSPITTVEWLNVPYHHETKFPRNYEDPGKFLIPCALQELDRTSALADSGASINLLPHSIYKKLGLEALTPTRMTLELANRSISHPMGIAEDVVVRVDVLPVKTSYNFVKFADELAPLNSLPPGNDDSTLKKDLHEENFQENTIMMRIDDCNAIEVSSNLEEGYFDSEGDIAFLDNLLSDDDSHNLDSKVTSDHEPEQNESSITFSPRIILSLMTVLNEISISQGNFHQNSVNESLPISAIPVEDSEPTQEEIDILLVPDDLIPPGVEDADFRR